MARRSRTLSDLIVVGGGVLGVWHAYHALRKGKRVVMLERNPVPQGASVRNFGQVVPSGLPPGIWRERGKRALKHYGSPEISENTSIRQNGSVYLASDEDEWLLLQEMKLINDNDGYECHLLSDKEVFERWPQASRRYVRGGLFFPQEMSVEPTRLVRDMIGLMIAKYGLEYLPKVTALSCREQEHFAEVTGSNGATLLAEQVIVCSGHELRTLFAEELLKHDLVTARLQMIQTVPQPKDYQLKGNILTGLTIRRYEAFHACPSYQRVIDEMPDSYLRSQGVHILFKQAVDGSLILGDSHHYTRNATTETMSFEIDYALNQAMLEEAMRIMEIPKPQIASTWNGYYTQTTKEVVNTKISDRVRIVTGIGGKGMTTGISLAEENIQATFG